MRLTLAIGALLKHLVGFCFFTMFGFMLGTIPIGLLISYLRGDWGRKEDPLYGGLIGAAVLSVAYLNRVSAQSKTTEEWNAGEQHVRQMLRWCYCSLAGFVLGFVLDPFESYFISADVAGLAGFYCFSIGYLVVWLANYSLKRKRRTPQFDTNQPAQ